MKRVTGIGGIFFKCKDLDKLKAWYGKHLGLEITDYGTNFEWREAEDAEKKGSTVWSPFKESTEGTRATPLKQFMINYRVENLRIARRRG